MPPHKEISPEQRAVLEAMPARDWISAKGVSFLIGRDVKVSTLRSLAKRRLVDMEYRLGGRTEERSDILFRLRA